jgi:hypothetical protein
MATNALAFPILLAAWDGSEFLFRLPHPRISNAIGNLILKSCKSRTEHRFLTKLSPSWLRFMIPGDLRIDSGIGKGTGALA